MSDSTYLLIVGVCILLVIFAVLGTVLALIGLCLYLVVTHPLATFLVIFVIYSVLDHGTED